MAYNGASTPACLRAGVIIALVTGGLYGQGATVSIQGTVTSSSTGQPVGGAIVTAIRNGLPPLTQNAATTAAGAFTFSGLPAATYRLCVQVAADGYLNPCTWSPAPPTATVVSGKTTTGVQLPITPGSVLSVRINDPANVLSAIGKASQAPPLMLMVRTATGFFEPLIMRSADAAGSTYEVTIPFDTAVPLWVSSPALKLLQAGATAVAGAGQFVPVTHPSAAAVSPPQLSFQISGLIP